MQTPDSLFELARHSHDLLPPRIRAYLNARGIPDEIIDRHLLGWNGQRITIPIFNREGELAFFKLAKDPEDHTDSPKMLATPGASAELYGWEEVLRQPSRIILCEGEFDRLVLEANGFSAATSTGGAQVFRREWAEAFREIPEVYLCFDRDEAGEIGARKVGWLIPHAKIVRLPEEVGEGGDVTDFFVRFGRSREEFLALLSEASPAPPPPRTPIRPVQSSQGDPESRDRIDQLKRAASIEKVIGERVILAPSGLTWRGLCSFHEDHRPSLVVYPEQGTFHCYGCGKHGDVITFLREIEHLSFAQAVEVLDQLQSGYGTEPQNHH